MSVCCTKISSCNLITDTAVLWKTRMIFFYLNRWAKKCFVCRIRICGEIYTRTAEHVFISNGYIYAATACRLWRVKLCIFENLDVYYIILWCIFEKSLCIFYNLDVYSKNLDVDYIVLIHIWKVLMYIL